MHPANAARLHRNHLAAKINVASRPRAATIHFRHDLSAEDTAS